MTSNQSYLFRSMWKTELNGPRNWKIKVTQIPCDCRDKEGPEMEMAPPGKKPNFFKIVDVSKTLNCIC
jgi:hypothetical protein